MEENSNVINQWAKPQRKGGVPNFEISVEKCKGRGTQILLKFDRGKYWRKQCWKNLFSVQMQK